MTASYVFRSDGRKDIRPITIPGSQLIYASRSRESREEGRPTSEPTRPIQEGSAKAFSSFSLPLRENSSVLASTKIQAKVLYIVEH